MKHKTVEEMLNDPQAGSKILEPYLQQAMKLVRELADYGFQKHGHNSIQGRMLTGDRNREYDRLKSQAIVEHIEAHGFAYLAGEKHDHFGTLEHQLAACIINSVMELYLAGLLAEQHEVETPDGPCDSIFCPGCGTIKPMIVDCMGGADISGKFDSSTDLVCNDCRLVITTMYRNKKDASKRQEKFYVVFWPGEQTDACERHKDALQQLGVSMGFPVEAREVHPDRLPVICKNCENEKYKAN